MVPVAMKTNANTTITVDSYIGAFAPDIQVILQTIRQLIKETAPDAVEKIGYGMPAYMLHGPLVYFGAFKHHVGLYPTGRSLDLFSEELSAYKTSKGAIQFPLDQPIPYDLIRRIVLYRIQDNLQLAAEKQQSKKAPK